MTGLAKELALIPTLSLAELADRWHAQALGQLPRLPLRLLQRLYAQLLQEQALGGLLPSVARELGKFEAGTGKGRAPSPPPPRQVMLSVGTRLVREWNGRTISVDVQGEGYVWNEQHYGSLSEIARAVTGTRWSGPRFFGIAGRG
jgi:hypothetical protein